MTAVVGRQGAVARLMALDGRGELATAHVRLVAVALGITERTVWNWVSAARSEGRFQARVRGGFTATAEVRRLLALWGGNVAAVHRQLAERAGEEPAARDGLIE
ncbi:hypothetical protein [Wenjunlia tyrosinilytica]|uniref:Uncharacterized protein n=1 Tax=Wenjunlia tyrosinilytica TaxID=1544741 RepID=A0A917ZYE4_9ACTN|nr:hypothetical protein [Wenjunlia tyrosinilytica]GGO99778.1 hypothetical protein GCM10012280_67000 [Wenjunlia tyrosinilytica]